MATFTLVGSPEPFLHVSMKRGESIYCESDAMVMVEQNLEVTGKLRGGVFQAFMRKFTSGESLFQQQIKASNGDGECLLSPNLDGDMQILDVGQRQYILSDGAFVAATEHTNIKAKVQSNIGGALFGGTGGFVVMETGGQGQVCISGSGTLLELDITPEQGEVTIDNGHVAAWDASLNYNIGMPTSGGGGIVGNIFNSLTSGEGLVIKFRGHGKVIVCSRNRASYLQWLASALGRGNSN
ncbi:TIGR00266 family protein [Acinetobacter sichuanensis]|uniref:TIGR00266 family protein n=1 Tax=Acinetobacter sichuanensis TaxID=2136183 RepID=A0A371YPH4_9GAMM|nr:MULTISPECIES: TIGR00266 family protein [Acinetobacter]MDM1247256.1 TIGR00266 family protein [Acinetobacter sp. R933-2]MDM1757070.1 TIGR00266 family protein [Acinetobacter sp. 256-1]MDM1760147.1 TIGR00266 family protein [Acinetobacter sp. 251-1]RFC83254.1 TIGR00266 family protein [Acinetobacter sichuanensis]